MLPLSGDFVSGCGIEWKMENNVHIGSTKVKNKDIFKRILLKQRLLETMHRRNWLQHNFLVREEYSQCTCLG